jgi:UDP-N-acetylglucosamine--N-acetylmuramyl-(pentapeptide) pyrophosphoryl-undecaprenol N-acetylglucosamine transferase
MTLLSVPADSQLPGNGSVPVSTAASQADCCIIMAGGGTGGHIYPGLAVLEQLEQSRRPGAAGIKSGTLSRRIQVIWAATPRRIDQRLLGQFGSDYIPQAIRPFSSNPLRWPGFYVAWHQTCRYWRDFMAGHNVTAVLALGGYAAGAVAHEAFKRNIPVGLLNPDALAGRANRFLMPRSNMIFTQWPLEGTAGKQYAARARVVGCPIRRALVRMDRSAAAEKLALAADRKTLVVTGASLGAQTINQAVAELLLHDAEFKHILNGGGESRWQILHLAGLEHAAALQALARRVTDIPWKILDYCDDMAAVWSMADLAITRAGAGTCAELVCMGVPAILMPYPFHKDRHQEANAQHLCATGAAIRVTDTKDFRLNAVELKAMLMRLLSEPDRLAEMAMAARAQAQPHAAAAVAEWLMQQLQRQIGVQNQ